MNTAALLSTLGLVWSIAVLCKLACARPYVFTQWDGGLMLNGTEIGRTGKTILLVLCSAIVLVALYVLVGASRW